MCGGRSMISRSDGMKSYFSSLSFFLLCFSMYSVILLSINVTPLLLIVKVAVQSFLPHKIFVSVVFHQAALIDNHDFLSVLQSGKSVGNNQDCSALADLFEIILNNAQVLIRGTFLEGLTLAIRN